jgi:hypothetical protein
VHLRRRKERKEVSGAGVGKGPCMGLSAHIASHSDSDACNRARMTAIGPV